MHQTVASTSRSTCLSFSEWKLWVHNPKQAMARWHRFPGYPQQLRMQQWAFLLVHHLTYAFTSMNNYASKFPLPSCIKISNRGNPWRSSWEAEASVFSWSPWVVEQWVVPLSEASDASLSATYHSNAQDWAAATDQHAAGLAEMLL